MKSLKVTVLDLAASGPSPSPFSRVMNANRASLMPQAVAVWCERRGHDVRFICYTGLEDLEAELSGATDLLIICAFTRSAQLAYALSNMGRMKGAITVLGGPHARSFPEDAAKYFDYVLGLTDEQVLDDVLRDASPHRPLGVNLAAAQQPRSLPSVQERWKFIAPTIAKTRVLKLVPMLGSMGCPYTCNFCIDAAIPYQPLDLQQIQDDLRFLVKTVPRPFVAWHDPNFGVRFDDYLGAIEEAVPKGSVSFGAESSLSILSEPNLKRLAGAGCKAILPGVESWFSHGDKSKTGSRQGEAKLHEVVEHANVIARHIPYVQANFVLGLDCDHGAEPFELTKQFISRAPSVFPAFSLLTCYGRGTPLNLDLQAAGRVLPLPFHFLNSGRATNVKPLNYEWAEFFRLVADLSRYSLSLKQVAKRSWANTSWAAKGLNMIRGLSSSKPRHYARVRGLMESDPEMKAFHAGTSRRIPAFYLDKVKKDLGPFWDHLPEGALEHDERAYLRSEETAGDAVAEVGVETA